MIYYRGQWWPATTPLLGSSNRAFRYADAAFESMRLNPNGQVIWLDKHLKRLKGSLSALSISHTGDWEDLETILANSPGQGTHRRARLQVFRNDGGLYRPDTDEADWLLEIEPIALDDTAYPWLGKAVKAHWSNAELPQHKLMAHKCSANSIWYVLIAREAGKRGFDDLLLADSDGYLIEAGRGNLVVLMSDGWVKPEQPGYLKGIAQQVLTTNASKGIQTRLLHMEDLIHAKSIAITNAVIGCMPVKSLAGRELDIEPVRDLSLLFA
jgi:branched-subunit amino acid aminotransferase/4-amino-4-deoxychorismate lyase